MKFLFRAVLLTVSFSTPLLFAQTNTSDIFADMQNFDPAPAAAPAAPEVQTPAPSSTASETPAVPAIEMPRPAPAPEPSAMDIQIPPQETPVIYTAGDSESTPVATTAEKPEPVDAEAWIARGKKAYADGDFDQAQRLFEAVLFDDAYNKNAIRWLNRIADKKAGREEKSYNTTRDRMLAEVQASWNTPKTPGERPDPDTVEREPTENELRANALREKLQNILIPAITFQDADIQQVVLELSALCRKLDPERKGVNLVVFGTSETILPPVTFSGTDLTALETLDIITQMSGMKYDIGPNLVSLTPVNYEPPQQMVSTEFDILPAVGSKIIMRLGGEVPEGLIDVRDFFSTIPFPPGASAQYNPEFNVLLVRNVPKHLDQISGLLARYNRKALEERSRQVEIETKFIEVSQGALDELGFEWTLGAAGTTLTAGNYGMPGGQKLFTDTLRTGAEALDRGVGTAGRATTFNSYARAMADSVDSGLIGTAGELLIQKTTGTPVDLVIKALERSAGSDLLSAPKILTKSGETATIHVGEVHWYPTAFDVALERYSQPSLIPLDYKEEKTGVILEVTPDLDPGNGTINMKLSPEIRELAGYDEQHVGTLFNTTEIGSTLGVPDEATDASWANVALEWIDMQKRSDENRNLLNDRLIARQPVFKSRKVDTTVTIEDGSTIAMGGLIKEQLETFKDSVPILGKIPIIGRLFRSEGEKSVKRNLLIFVTANQVDASGHKKNTE